MKPQPPWSSAEATASATILSNIVRSQTEEHAPFGGVVPEIAARAHVDVLDGLVANAMKEAGVGFAQLSAVAAAAGPGLIGGVIVGLTTAKAIAMVHDTPLIAVNHLEAHALTPRLSGTLAFPYCLFLASGGHTQIVAVIGVGQYVRLGTTVDDAMGEAFDKVAKMLGLPYPGGPQVERAARTGDAEAVCVSAADARARRCQFLVVGIEDRGAQRGQPADAAGGTGHQRSLRQLSGGGAGIHRRPAQRRAAAVPRTVRSAAARWSPPAASPPIRRSAARCRRSPRRRRPR